jgi:uncharacterized damage-inducible protein DinB
MNRTQHLCLIAEYNQWMNAKLYEAAMTLPDHELVADRKAFFGSILGTLNHLVLVDILWLKRFANHSANYPALEPVRLLPTPPNLDQLLFPDLKSLSKQRKLLDAAIIEWTKSISEGDLDSSLGYLTTKGVAAQKNFFSLILHFFNHQTHHRGQATTLLTQAGVDVRVTDLVALIPNVDMQI